MEGNKGYKYTAVIFCLTYNHEKYVRHTLDSIISQETDYSYKIIVHDDASTDNTQEIIKEYVQKYPHLVGAILRKENQFKKGINIVNEYIEELREGKYIAYCEGDDFWTDKKKLQKQIEYMETHEDCSLCVHNTKKVDEEGNDIGQVFNSSNRDMKYNAMDVIEAGGGGLFHTSAFLFRTALRDVKPSCYNVVSVGDYPMAIYLATRGYVYYMDSVMSAYRVASVQSWSVQFESNIEKKKNHYMEMVKSLKLMDEETKYQYTKSFKKVLTEYEYLYLFGTYQLHKILNTKSYRDLFFKNPIPTQIKYIIKSLLKEVMKK